MLYIINFRFSFSFTEPSMIELRHDLISISGLSDGTRLSVFVSASLYITDIQTIK